MSANMVITPRSPLKKFLPLGLAVYTLFCLVSAITLARHELWGDELQGWNTVRSSSFSDLLSFHHNFHPYLWNTVVFVISRFTANPESMQVASWVIICAVAFVLVFRSPFPLVFNVLLLCGYFFLFEYACFSRGYSLALLFCLLLCSVFEGICHKDAEAPSLTKRDNLLFSMLLILLGSSHVLGLFIAFAFLISYIGIHKKRTTPGIIFPVLVLLFFAITYIVPEGGDTVNSGSWARGIHPSMSAQVPLRAFFPIPDFTKEQFWNSNLLVDHVTSRVLQGFFVIALMLFLSLILRGQKKALLLFLSSAFFVLVFALVFPMTSTRYVGFLFLAFISAIWIGHGSAFSGWKKIAVYALVIIQVPGGFFAMYQDWVRPFSQYQEVKPVVAEAKGYSVITDTWGLNYLNATFDASFYSIDTGAEERRVLLSNPMIKTIASVDRYKAGLERYFSQSANDTVFLFSTNSGLDSLTTGNLNIRPYVKREGAIEKFSNIFLYKVFR